MALPFDEEAFEGRLVWILGSPRTGSSWLLPDSYARALSRLLGLPEYDAGLIERLGGDRIFLDGLLSLWHPE